MSTPTSPAPIPVSLYAHFPWCVRKCPYCDFNSHPLREELPEASYIAALISDWQSQREVLGGRTLTSVFFGGGTPSLLQPESFAALLETLAPHLSSDAEITMEANPGTLEYGSLSDYRAAGINRLSLGVQSFNDRGAQETWTHSLGARGTRCDRESAGRRFQQHEHRSDAWFAWPGRSGVQSRTSQRRSWPAFRTFPTISSPSSRAPNSPVDRRSYRQESELEVIEQQGLQYVARSGL